MTNKSKTATEQPASEPQAEPGDDQAHAGPIEWEPINPLTDDDRRALRNMRAAGNPELTRWDPATGLRHYQSETDAPADE